MKPHRSAYTVGEVTGLIAPVVGVGPGNLADWVIVAVRNDGSILTASSDEDSDVVIQLLAVAIGELAGDLR